MSFAHQHRTYEEHDGKWVVVHPARAGIFRRAAHLAVMGLMLAVIGVVGVAAALVGLLVLPIGLLVGWFFNRSAHQPRN
jgi:hypothetical protein